MDKKKIIIIGSGVVGAGLLAWAAKSALQTNSASKKLHVLPQNFKFLGKSAGIDVGGYLRNSVDFKFYSTASSKMTIKINSISIIYNGKEIGFSTLNNSVAVLDPVNNIGEAYIKGIEIQIPYMNAIGQGILNDIINPNGEFTKKLSFNIEVTVNGFTTTETVDFNEDQQLGLVAAGPRNIKSGEEYNHLFPDVTGENVTVKNDGSVEDTVLWAGEVVKKYHNDTVKLAPKLKGKSIDETLRNIFDFAYNHLQYHLDRPNVEELRRPARSWYDRKHGIDCDDFTIFVSSILYNLKIPFIFRITKYDGKANYQHIYAVAIVDNKEYVVDPVVDTYNYEKRFSDHRDFTMKELGLANNLSGLPIELLGKTSESSLGNLADVMMGTDLLEGLQGIGSTQQEEQALYNYLVKTRKAIDENPELVSSVQNPSQMKNMFDMAIKYFWTDKRQEVLDRLADLEDSLIDAGNIELHGYEDDWEEDFEFSGVETEDPDYDYLYYDDSIEGFDASLGRLFKRKSNKSSRKPILKRIFKPKTVRVAKKAERKEKRVSRQEKRTGFFKKVASAVKTGVKKAAKVIVKVNPVSVAARTSFLLALRTNAFKVADKLSFAYMTSSQATAKGLDASEYAKIKQVHAKVVTAFKRMGGNEESLKKAILSGKRKDLRGIEGFDSLSDMEGIEGLEGIEGVLEVFRHKRGMTKTKSERRIVSKKQAKVENNDPLLTKVRIWLNNIKTPQSKKAVQQKVAQNRILRSNFIKALQKNPQGITSILYYGYMPANTAKAAGYSNNEYQLIKKALSNTVYAYSKQYQGNPVDLKNTVIRYHNVAISGFESLGSLDGETVDLIKEVAKWLKDVTLKLKERHQAKKAAKQEFFDKGGTKEEWKKEGRKDFKQDFKEFKAQQEEDVKETEEASNATQTPDFPQGKILSDTELAKLQSQGVDPVIIQAIQTYGLSMELINYYNDQGLLEGLAGSQFDLLLNMLSPTTKVATTTKDGVVAEKQGFIKRAGTYIKEHKKQAIITGVVLALIATGTAYAIHESKKQKQTKKRPAKKRTNNLSGTGSRSKSNTQKTTVKKVELK